MNDVKTFDIEKTTVEAIEWLGKFGKTSDNGITRLLYTPEWINAQKGLEELLRDKGFEAYYDEVGNLFGRIEGSKYKEETILTGSHIDTVVNGGRLDGQLGIIGGIIALEYLKKSYGVPLRNIEVVSMAEEEGSRFPYTFWGSRNIIGTVKKEEMENLKDANGIGFSKAMHDAAFDFKDENSKGREDIKEFVELHIEQGGVLEKEGKSIGIVEHIVGQKRYMIEIEGEANHAGTTPMGYRRDALFGASKMIAEIFELATAYGDPLVATVGKVEVTPNTTNVVPGKVMFSLDIRHTHEEISLKFRDDIISRLQNIAKSKKLDIKINNYMDCLPTEMDSRLVKKIKDSCDKKGLKYKLMHSGAGHDAQIFAKAVPTAMIFVPSHNGISHSYEEFTEPKDYVEGIKALIETIYCLAYN